MIRKLIIVAMSAAFFWSAAPLRAQIGATPLVAPLQVVVPPAIGTPTSFGTAVQNSNAGTTTFSTTANILSGNMICVGVASQNGTVRTVSSVAIGTNNLAQSVAQSVPGDGQAGDIWCKANATFTASGATVTVTFSGSVSFGVIVQTAQVLGIIPSSPLDNTGVGPGTHITNPTASTGVLSQANEIVFQFFSVGPSTITADAAFNTISNQVTGNGNVNAYFAYKKVAATTSVTAAPTTASGVAETLMVASYKGY